MGAVQKNETSNYLLFVRCETKQAMSIQEMITLFFMISRIDKIPNVMQKRGEFEQK